MIEKDKLYDRAEYFSLVEDSDHKLEYHYGRVYAMAGGTANHSIIGNNIRRRLSENLDDTNCVVFDSDMALEMEEGNRYVYPDAMVVCGDREYANENNTQIKNPILIVEVLSKGTKNYDRTDKFRYYRSVPSLKEYVIIYSDKPVVETFYRESDGLWRIGSASTLEDSIHLYSLDVNISMTQIFSKTEGLKNPLDDLLKNE